MAQIKTSPPNSICILRLSAIGDVCHAIAMVQQIQRRWPRTRITWIIGRTEYQFVQNIQGIEFIIFNKNQGLAAYAALAKHLRRRQFDILLHMQTAIRASVASLFIRAKRRIGFDRERAKECQWLFTNESISPQTSPHVLDGFMAFAEHVGLEKTEPTWNIPRDKPSMNWVRFITADKPFAILSASASNPERNWTIDNYVKLCEYICSLNYSVVLTSGPDLEEVAIAKTIARKTNARLINLAGSTNLLELTSLIRSAEFVIAPDSGPTHIAVTVGTPVIGIYAHSNPGRTGPWLFREYTVSHYESNVLQQYGKSASQLRWGIRAKGKALMEKIKFDEVRIKLDSLLENRKIPSDK